MSFIKLISISYEKKKLLKNPCSLHYENYTQKCKVTKEITLQRMLRI